jgi:hypothetical protein
MLEKVHYTSQRFYFEVQITPEKSPSFPSTLASPLPAPRAQYLITVTLQWNTFSLEGPWEHFAVLRLFVL